MATKHALPDWVIEALRAHDGSASIVDVCRHIWQVHETGLRHSGDLFDTWQYDIRWAAHRLRDAGRMKSDSESPNGTWELTDEQA